jgi:Peptidase family S41
MYRKENPLKHRLQMLFCAGGSLFGASITSWSAPAEASSPPPSPAPSTESRPITVSSPDENQKDLEAVLSHLRASYVDQATLNSNQPSNVRTILARLGLGAYLQTSSAGNNPEPVHPFKSEIIEGQFGFIRLGLLSKDVIPRLDGALADFKARNLTGLILDLRTCGYIDDFSMASDLLGRFVPKGKDLFELIHAGPDPKQVFRPDFTPVYQGPIAVLVGPDTSGPAEAIAGVLKSEAHALILGEKTAGRGVSYQKFILDSGAVLMVAVSKVRLAAGPVLFPDGVQPDIVIKIPAAEEAALLHATDTEPLAPYVMDEERPHNNEAALVAGRNPELDVLEAQTNNSKYSTLRAKDIVVQRALDFLITVGILQAR